MIWRALRWCWVLGASTLLGCGGSAFESANDGAGGAVAQAGGSAVQAGAAQTAGGSTNGGSQTVNAGSSGDGVVGGTGGSTTGGDANASGTGGAPPPSECPCSAPTPTCENGRCVVRGPSMVKADGFYIDGTEVTNADYAVFVAHVGDAALGKQAKACVWNLSFEPQTGANVSSGLPTEPVTNVDFCDATAYCAWADKKLCGKLGGGSLALAELADASKAEWFAACGGPKGQLYPYGSGYRAGVCNDAAGGVGHVAPVGSRQACTGYYQGLTDMVGNVAEWVNACDDDLGRLDGCETIGGSFEGEPLQPTCSSSGLRHRDEQLPNVGFRCCSQ